MCLSVLSLIQSWIARDKREVVSLNWIELFHSEVETKRRPDDGVVQSPLKRQQTQNSLHRAISQKTAIFIHAALRT
jgi:hypothetical protein